MNTAITIYAKMEPDAASVCSKAAERIKLRLNRTVEDIIEIGRDLALVKNHLGRGPYGAWLKEEFGMSLNMAARFINVHAKFSQLTPRGEFKDISQKALFLLAAPSTKDEVIEAVVVKGEAGEDVTEKVVQKLKDEFQAKYDKDKEGLDVQLDQSLAKVKTAEDAAKKLKSDHVASVKALKADFNKKLASSKSAEDLKAVKEAFKKEIKALKDNSRKLKDNSRTEIKKLKDTFKKQNEVAKATAKKNSALESGRVSLEDEIGFLKMAAEKLRSEAPISAEVNVSRAVLWAAWDNASGEDQAWLLAEIEE